jgi:hypothetical protein
VRCEPCRRYEHRDCTRRDAEGFCCCVQDERKAARVPLRCRLGLHRWRFGDVSDRIFSFDALAYTDVCTRCQKQRERVAIVRPLRG